jgi:hypothetical protein
VSHTGQVTEVGPGSFAMLAEELNLTTGETRWFERKKEVPMYEATGDTPRREARKALPLWSFLFGYFPDAWVEVVRVAVVGNQKHNPGEPLHWERSKSTDQLNTAFRHLFDYGKGVQMDTDGVHHLAKAIWRLSAQLQLELERMAK